MNYSCIYTAGLIYSHHSVASKAINTTTVLKILATVPPLKPEPTEMPVLQGSVLIADVLGKGLGLPYDLLVRDIVAETVLPDGNWTGLIGIIKRGEIDISSGIVLNEDTAALVSLSYPIHIDEVTFRTDNPEFQHQRDAFLRPFTKGVWIAVVSTIIIISVIFYACFFKKYTYGIVILAVIGNLLHQGWNLKSDTISKNTLSLTWSVGSMIIALSYAAVLLSFLTFPPKDGVRDIAGLSKAVAKGTHECATIFNSDIPYVLLMSEDKSIRLIGSNMKAYPGHNDPQYLKTTQKKLAFIATRSTLTILKERYFVSDDNFYHQMRAPSYKENFCCKEKLNDVIMRATAAGIFEKISQDVVFTSSKPLLMKFQSDSQDYTKKSLSVSDLWGAFAILLVGYALAFFVLLIEIVYSKT